MSLIQRKLDAEIAAIQPRSATDFVIEVLTPIMVFIMVSSLVLFLLDVRWVYTEVHDKNLRFVAIAFLIGVVALNRLIARDGSQESQLYFVALAAAIGLYTVATTNMYNVGSITGADSESAWLNLGINMAVVCFVWWATNRLTHECCVDENPTAGEIGILTGTVQQFRKAMTEGETKKEKPKEPLWRSKKPTSVIPENTIEAFDPLDWQPPEDSAPRHVDIDFTQAKPKRHPGISIFYFSVPVMFAFAVGLRVTQHGGEGMLRMGHFYLACYCVSALSLLMLSSLAGLREYFRSRGTRIPGGIGPFWAGLGVIMIAMVLVGALSLPMPKMPALAIVESHEHDPWGDRTRTFEPMPVVSTAAERLEQNRFVERISQGVLVCFAIFVGYALLKGVGAAAFAIAKDRHRWPRWVVRLMERIDRFLQRITTLPELPTFERRRRVSRQIATSVHHRNPMAEGPGHYTPVDAVAKSYDALCALAYDLGVPRRPDQTPYEFIDHFPKELKNLKDEAVDLTDMLVAAEYAGRPVSEKDLDTLRKFWIQFERVRNRIVK